MRKTKKRMNRRGMGTVEIVIIIAVLVALALLFRAGLSEYGQKVMDYCFDDSKITSAF
ncbi:Flp1 family type IVb pilin [Butyrivibrio sp. AE2032]|uniref:Flp1 family type IVb pilin n=1 Tax=Butyrivibrio sp. AE2032 TaxID=1458463 RepID=UPI0009DE2198|nr:Flp1 family type IVb pilin [Butyrivibrio sp. AE2032]